MILQSEGAVYNLGLKLKEAAQLMKEYGAVIAFDSGGGGDVTTLLDGVSLTTPENPQGAERYLPQALLVYKKDSTMANGIAKEKLGKTLTIRTSPQAISGNDTGRRIAAYAQFDFVSIHDDIDYPNNPAYQWLKLPDGMYVTSVYPPNGERVTIIQPPSIDPPTPPVASEKITNIDIDLPAGALVTITKADGTKVVYTS
jgi:hypothetical protein